VCACVCVRARKRAIMWITSACRQRTHTHTHTHTRTHPCAHTHTRARTHTRMRTHTHAHTPSAHPSAHTPSADIASHMLYCAASPDRVASTPVAPWRGCAASKCGVLHGMTSVHLCACATHRRCLWPRRACRRCRQPSPARSAPLHASARPTHQPALARHGRGRVRTVAHAGSMATLSRTDARVI
jgi:hypothetical protein